MNLNPIIVTAEVHAPIAHVWTCWTEPKHITQWCFASSDWCAPRASNDLRTGGRFSTRMESVDGSMGFDFEGVYSEVQHQKRIAYEMADGRKVLIEFKSIGNTTSVTETFDPESENPMEMQREGWQAILNNFKLHAEKTK